MPRGENARTSFSKRAALGAVLILCALLVVVGWLVWSRVGPPAGPAQATLAELIGPIERGEPHAVALAKTAANREWPQSRQVLQAMLSHQSWRVRASGCEILAARPDRKWVDVLLPRCSDSDWRVRAAAFAALSRLRAVPASASLRDIPLDQREKLLLAWLDAHDAGAVARLGPELCELYAGVGHVEFGRPLAGRCLSCHAGAATAALTVGSACASCHGQIHADWKGSAHAQSLSHLQLTTIDGVSRQPKRMGFGSIRGLSCVECHRLDGSRRPTSTSAATRPARCPFAFRRAEPAATSCARCHATTHRQWQSWRRGRQPRRAQWPPGQLDMDFRGDARGCIDCHMRPVAGANGRKPRDHRWLARRDIQLLREGIDVQVVQVGAGSERKLRLTLTNLSGHAYPAGTRRRAVRVYAGSADAEQLRLVAALSPVRPGRLWSDTQPALAPGEQRTFSLFLPADAAAVAYRLVYCRDLYRPEGYTAEILSGSKRLSP